MKILNLLTLTIMFTLFFTGCKDEVSKQKAEYDPSKPIVLKSFYPLEGGARTKILLDGENFGTDPSKIKVYFNNAEASIVSSNGDRIYAIVPRLPGEEPKISIVIGKDSVVYENSFIYHTQAQVSTVTGNGKKNFKPGMLSEAEVYGKYLELDAEGNIFMSWRDGGSPATINAKTKCKIF